VCGGSYLPPHTNVYQREGGSSMLKYAFRRLIAALVLLFIVIFVTFGLFMAIPADPARLSCGKLCDEDQKARIRHAMEIDIPVTDQYQRFIKGLFVGRIYRAGTDSEAKCAAPCLGYSFRTDESVTELIKRAAPVTFSIAIGASVIWLTGGVLIGMVSALRRGSWLDKLVQSFALFGSSLQIYLVGWVLLLFLVIKWNKLQFPIYTSPYESIWRWASGLMLPWITLAFLSMAAYARLTRAGLIETFSEDFVRTARANGLSRRRIQFKHALRAAITPIITIFGLDLGALLGGAVITESTFGLRGIGAVALEAVRELDLPVIIGTVIFAAFFIIMANLIVDLLYALLDPKVRTSQ
jgi:peptide/nickel transport system permease protein